MTGHGRARTRDDPRGRRVQEVRARLLAGLPVRTEGVGGTAARALAVAAAAGAPAVPALDAALAAGATAVARVRLIAAATAQARAVLLGMAAIPALALPVLGGILDRPLWPFYLSQPGATVGLAGLGLIGVGVATGRLLVRRADRPDPGYDEVADLLATALSGGVPPAPALRLVAEHLPRLADPLRRAASSHELGRRPDPAGDLGRILMVVRLSATYGTPAAPALRRLADDLRADRLAHVRAAAQRLPAHLAFPTALCYLPATLLLVGAPLLATGLDAAAAGGT